MCAKMPSQAATALQNRPLLSKLLHCEFPRTHWGQRCPGFQRKPTISPSVCWSRSAGPWCIDSANLKLIAFTQEMRERNCSFGSKIQWDFVAHYYRFYSRCKIQYINHSREKERWSNSCFESCLDISLRNYSKQVFFSHLAPLCVPVEPSDRFRSYANHLRHTYLAYVPHSPS